MERLQAFGAGPDELDHLRMYSFAGLPPLDTAEGGEHLLALAVTGGAALVVIDTTSRMVRGKENDADTFLALYRCSLVPLKGRGITVLRLDHPGKDETRGQRGSSAKEGDVDTIWRLVTTGPAAFRLEREKSRSGHGEPLIELRRRFGPLRHEWGTAEDPAVPVARKLDTLGVPQDAGRPTARRALDKAGYEVSNTLLEAAIRLRKSGRTARGQANQTPDPPMLPGTCPDDSAADQESAGHRYRNLPRAACGQPGQRASARLPARTTNRYGQSGSTRPGQPGRPPRMTAPRPAVRSRKARKNSRLACGCYVRVGERIIRCPDGRWRCAQCVIATLTAAPPEPGRGGQDGTKDTAA